MHTIGSCGHGDINCAVEVLEQVLRGTEHSASSSASPGDGQAHSRAPAARGQQLVIRPMGVSR